MSSHQRMIGGFVVIMAAAAVLACVSLGMLYRIQLRVESLNTSFESPSHSPTSENGFQNGLNRLNKDIQWSYAAVVLTGAIGTAISLAMIWLIGRKLGNTLRNIASGLQASSDELMASANQATHSSRTLAENSSHAAASIEETSSSLEEMASMTARNAEHAHDAKQLARQARSAADTGAADMVSLYEAIGEIQAGSDSVVKIVRTIDEIAFQTNILALNAAVEAARAGEAGQGFAVVAEEVRSLAQRSAAAARETAERIQEAMSRTKLGVQLAEKVSGGLQEIVEGNQKLDALAGDVATASEEQRKGIEHLRSAVLQMDQVTQGNAATAEETAESTSLLHQQVAVLRKAVIELLDLVDGHTEPDPSPSKHCRPADKGATAIAGNGGVKSSETASNRSQNPATAELSRN